MCFRLATVPPLSTEKGLEQQLGGLDGRLARWPSCLDTFNWRDIVPRLVVIISTGSRSKAAAVQKADRSGFRFHPGRPIGSVTTI